MFYSSGPREVDEKKEERWIKRKRPGMEGGNAASGEAMHGHHAVRARARANFVCPSDELNARAQAKAAAFEKTADCVHQD
jgi:hypothetical protein